MNRFIPIAVLFILAIVVAVLGIWPSYQEMVDLKNQEEVKQAELKNRELYVQNLRDIDVLLDERELEIAKLNAIIPDDSQVPLLYNLLQKTASNSGLSFREIFSTVKKDEDSGSALNTISVDMQIEGFYSGIKEFLIAARKAERLLDVKSVGFSTPEDKTKPIKFLVEIDSFSY